MRRRTTAGFARVVGLLLTCGACSVPSASASAPRSSSATPAGWAKIDHALSELGPEVGFVAARVSRGGTCRPVHAVAASTPRPTASQFKLFVLGALARQIAAGRLAWDQLVPVPDAVKSLGNSAESGSLQFAAPGATVTIADAATKMISISDNTAADLLAHLVGRHAVERQMRRWTANTRASVPFLTTRQMLLLHYATGLGERYLATPRRARAAFLASSVDPLPLGAVAAGYSTDPRHIDDIEWFASPRDLCRTYAGLHRLSKQRGLARLSTVLSRADFGLALDPSAWPTVWFKGGSEPGVLTLGWLATDRHGKTFVVEAMVANPDAALSQESYQQLTAVARAAFGRLG